MKRRSFLAALFAAPIAAKAAGVAEPAPTIEPFKFEDGAAKLNVATIDGVLRQNRLLSGWLIQGTA